LHFVVHAMSSLLIYGADSTTGAVIASRAAARSLNVILAGTDKELLRQRAAALGGTGHSFVVFGLDDAATVDESIRSANPAIVLNCCSPFATSAPALVDACIRLKKNYLDICDELAVLELVRAEHSRAVNEGVLLMPGVGLRCSVLECMAAEALVKLPGADAIIVSFCCDEEPDMHIHELDCSLHISKDPVIRRAGTLCKKRLTSLAKFSDATKSTTRCTNVTAAELCVIHDSTGVDNIVVCNGSW
jgi:hypothetical protein